VRYRPSIGTVLLLMNLTLLALPVSGLWVLRLYDSSLVRQTEAQLIAQSVTVAAQYRALWRDGGGVIAADWPPVDPEWMHREGFDDPWLPRSATLDLANDPVLPASPEAEPATAPPDPVAARAGGTLNAILREVQLQTLAGIRVVDRAGLVVASTGEELGEVLVNRDEVRRALLGEPVSVLRLRGKGPAPVGHSLLGQGSAVRVVTALPVIEGQRVIGVVVAARTPRSVGEVLAEKRLHLAGLLSLLVVAAATLSLLGWLAIGRPLRAVAERARRVSEGERGAFATAAPGPVREVADLSAALSRMAESLEHRADYIRDFAAHMSHEFKTPLATISGTVELLRDHLGEMSDAERDRFFGNLHAESTRLARLVQRLLDLARADMVAADPIGQCRPAAQLAAAAQERPERFEARIAGDPAIRMAPDIFASVYANLLENAIRHGGPEARIIVSLAIDGVGAVLTVADDGPGISPANAERIFTPFFTTARRQGGTGLGLAIVRSLVEAHGGAIRLLPTDQGAVFEVRLPLA